MNKKNKVPNSTATYVQKDGVRLTDLKELAKEYRNWGNIPRYIGDVKAVEISYLARFYLRRLKKCTPPK